ncbi:hypothetical protein GCM10010106_18250 [Thermopolyspora flexuosa]|uniref:Three-Cys-motif partner protein n=1 Tax=Thermopolyspora flexuosa TaxID=103836 RepID=A0A543J432_9ACTN|nr:three-Cys-motif partner protein TcmP [Thermopolyspora flexuosa]TQM77589.1 three-Cys-motif partner protein [Thermopolyspora flexuosa]GGM72274.1 hypothetical protein GCM10010106_18250 [Thermopolyspora flexuosa]
MGDAAPESGPSGFWDGKKPAAVLKHELLRRYLPVFVSKTGSTSPDGRVVYFDGYAGEGRYKDNSEGSPLIAVQVARQQAAQSSPRRLGIFLTEKQRAVFHRLSAILREEASDVTVVLKHGDVAKHVNDVIDFARSYPLFAFLDPYGTGLSYEAVLTLLNGRPRSTKTEVLMNFSAHLVRRVDRANEKKLRNIDRVCGGSWWRTVFFRHHSPSRGTDAVVADYRLRVCRDTGCGSWVVPVRNHESHEPVYYLVFFSRHRDGLWAFGEALSLAMTEWRRACWKRATTTTDEQPSFGFEDELFRDRERKLEREWVETITANLAALIERESAPFSVIAKYPEIMGETLGLARGKHIREAIKRLHGEGLTSTEGKGRIDTMVIRPPRS